MSPRPSAASPEVVTAALAPQHVPAPTVKPAPAVEIVEAGLCRQVASMPDGRRISYYVRLPRGE